MLSPCARQMQALGFHALHIASSLMPKSHRRTDVCFHEEFAVLYIQCQNSKHGDETTDTGASEAGH